MLFGAFHWAENALWPHFQTFQFFLKINKRWNLKLWFLKTVQQRVFWGKIWPMCQYSRCRKILNALRQELLSSKRWVSRAETWSGWSRTGLAKEESGRALTGLFPCSLRAGVGRGHHPGRPRSDRTGTGRGLAQLWPQGQIGGQRTTDLELAVPRGIRLFN